METTPQSVLVYETSAGDRPWETWLRGLRDSRARQKVRTAIARLRLGNFGDFKSVGGGVVELRIHYGVGYRVYCGRDDVDVVILLVGGNKRTQTADIKMAQEYWADYKGRKQVETNGDR